MEKKRPHYSLAEIKELIGQGSYSITQTARGTALSDFGMVDEQEILDIVLDLERKDFYKSMTSHMNNKIWQDVYKCHQDDNGFYIKVQIVDEQSIVISFKEV